MGRIQRVQNSYKIDLAVFSMGLLDIGVISFAT
jgi:hypothetical protein